MLIIAIIFLSGCSTINELTKPKLWGLGKTPEGSPIFQKGWNEGCQSGIHTYGGQRYSLSYEYKQDINLINNQEYYRAWKDAFLYCRWYAFSWSRDFNN